VKLDNRLSISERNTNISECLYNLALRASLLHHFITSRGNFCTQIPQIVLFLNLAILFTTSIIRRKKKSTLGNYIIQLIPQDAKEIIMPQCGRSTGKDKGAIPTVLYYSDRRKAVTNELGRPYEHRHISIHYLQQDALSHHALQCTRIPSSKFLLAFLRLLIQLIQFFTQVPFYICQTRLRLYGKSIYEAL